MVPLWIGIPKMGDDCQLSGNLVTGCSWWTAGAAMGGIIATLLTVATMVSMSGLEHAF